MFRSSLFLVMYSVSVIAAPSNSSVGVVPLEKSQPEIIPILTQSEDFEANGTYTFSYETGNGIKREETAFDKVLPPEARSAYHAHHDEDGDSDDDNNEIHVQRGSYSYTSPDGTIISLRYIANENGFQPQGEHLPKAPKVSNTEEVKNDNHISEKSEDKPDNESAASEHKETKAATPALLSRSATADLDSAVTETDSTVKDEAVTDTNDLTATEPETKVKKEEDLKSELIVNTEPTKRTTDLPSITELAKTPIVTETSEQITTDTNEADLAKESEATTQGGNKEQSTTDSATETTTPDSNAEISITNSATESDSSTTEVTATEASS